MNDLFTSPHFLAAAEEIIDAIGFFHQQGWCPATSSNFSFRLESSEIGEIGEIGEIESGEIFISRSGIDKGHFQIQDFLHIDLNGQVKAPPHACASAETDLHTLIYQKFPNIKCVLHTHSAIATVLSMQYRQTSFLQFQGLEILKGLSGIQTHDTQVRLPIVDNSQDISQIKTQVEAYLQNHSVMFGYLIAGHGLYTWGESIATAKRHVETLEFLLECEWLKRKGS